ncbi:hypothetical protein T265_12988, partial [Opisthorchis viverrini]
TFIHAIWTETDKNATDIGWQPYLVVSPTRHSEDHAVPILEAAMPTEEGTRGEIQPGHPSLDRSSQDDEVVFKPRTFWSVSWRLNH